MAGARLDVRDEARADARGGTNAADAQRFVDWLVADEAQRLIQSFGVERYGSPLLFPNSGERRRRDQPRRPRAVLRLAHAQEQRDQSYGEGTYLDRDGE